MDPSSAVSADEASIYSIDVDAYIPHVADDDASSKGPAACVDLACVEFNQSRFPPRRSSLLARMVSTLSNISGGRFQQDGLEPAERNPSKYLGFWSAICILINFISVGYILNPSGFAQGGTLLGPICLIVISFQTWITGTYVLEACARAEVMKVSITHSRHLVLSGHTIPIEPQTIEELELERATLGMEEDTERSIASGRKSRQRHLPTEDYSFRIHDRTYELSELCRIFLGPCLRNFFTLTTLGDLYGITWTFAAVFGSAFSQHLPMGSSVDYTMYILIFMAVTVPVSCMRFTLQVPLQLCFLIARTIMVLLMMGTLLAAFCSSTSHFGTQRQPARETPLANFSAIVTVLQLCVFSTAFQFSVPGLTAETGNKRSMKSIISGSVAYIYVTNLILSLTMAIYFGSAIEASSNLNWLHYHGGTWDGTGEFTSAWWAKAISSYIVLFAAFDGLAVYPLIAVSLGDIIMADIYQDNVHSVKDNWKIRIGFRLLASVPQAIGSIFVQDLGVMHARVGLLDAKYAGIFTLLSYTACPCYLAIRSRHVVEDVDLPSDTRYKTFASSDKVAWLLIGPSSVLIVSVIVEAATGQA